MNGMKNLQNPKKEASLNVIDYVDQYTRRLLRKRKRNILLNDLIENPD